MLCPSGIHILLSKSWEMLYAHTQVPMLSVMIFDNNSLSRISIYYCSMTCVSVHPPPDFMLLTVFSSVFISTGFEIWAFIPAASECWISSENALAVMAMIGIFFASSWELLRIAFCCLITIHNRHLHIHQDHVIVTRDRLFKCLQDFFAIFTDGTLCTLNL